jgi:heptose I phosphotransferase
MKLMLAEPFKRLWAGRDPFAEVERCRARCTASWKPPHAAHRGRWRGFFVKIHRGIGWGEIFKNLLTAKLPVLGAGQEWRAIQRLQEVGVPTMTAVAYGEKGSNPADQHSFIVTEELAPTVSLEDFSIDWVRQPPEPRLKRALIAEVAKHDRRHAPRRGQPPRLLHLPLPAAHRPTGHADDFKLSVIDLHRAQTRPAITRRWRNKDLAALYFSALDIGLTRRDKLRFLKVTSSSRCARSSKKRRC